jgi:pimeloyl-ACP methyl ester carboxylesterase
MIGFGLSAKPKNYNYSILDQANLCESFLKHLNISSFHILAHDYGDTVAQELLARHEEQQMNQVKNLDILSVCLLNGGLFPEAHKARPIQKLLNSPVGPIISRLFNESAFNKSFSAIFGEKTKPSPEELSEFWQLIDHEKGQYISHKIIRYINERKQYRERWVTPLQQTSVPVRLINGVDDPISGIHMAKRYIEIIPNPDVVLLENVAHYPQVEAPERVFSAFTEFHNDQKLK